MARSKKPRKAYVRGKVLAGGNLPMGLQKSRKYETNVLMAMQGLSHGFLNHDMAVELALFVTACSHLPDVTSEAAELINSATKALSAIHDRFTRTGKWGASGDDLRALEGSVPALLDQFKSLPSAMVVDATMSATKRFFK